ncbi:LytTR family DNA-binding domain-containing protein [Christensenella timonensis]|uniref:LytTR family DNA-binding domain-containing protein n=1 Tax=Christensenella timonensis TaxID=1816678 RepID=UPI00083679C6|nr:LytTR family DNA-binding domain-containing protein [Christensenella timonensis]
MKVRVEVQNGIEEDEVVIRCRTENAAVRAVCRFVMEQETPGADIVFLQGGREYYFPLGEVLFFETEGETVYAHTAGELFRVKYRLYELEESLPPYFVRISKSAIVNMRRIHAITRNITASSRIEFRNSCKHVYVSRRYYAVLKERLQERMKYER